jgi:hypothetical protein
MLLSNRFSRILVHKKIVEQVSSQVVRVRPEEVGSEGHYIIGILDAQTSNPVSISTTQKQDHDATCE